MIYKNSEDLRYRYNDSELDVSYASGIRWILIPPGFQLGLLLTFPTHHQYLEEDEKFVVHIAQYDLIVLSFLDRLDFL